MKPCYSSDMAPEDNGSYIERDIKIDAPNDPGVYQIACHTPDKQDLVYIYVGQAKDIQYRLLEHLRGESDQAACIDSHGPEFFFSEVIFDPRLRDAQEQCLIEALTPHCNKT